MSEFLTTSGLAKRLVEKTGISMEVAKKFSTVFFMIVRKGLKDNETFSVYNFGTFKKTWIEATVGLNPSTGQKINIPAHWRIKFIPCSAVAKRLNRPYAHLKAKELPDDEPDVITEPQSVPIPEVVDASDAEDDFFENNLNDQNIPEDDDDDEIDYSAEKKNLKFLVYAGIALLFLILLITLLLKSCTGKARKDSKKQKAKVETSVAEKDVSLENSEIKDEALQEFDASADEAKIEEELELQQASFLFEYYTVPNGSDYHTIAEKQYGNRHLWPVIYAENKREKPDPDLIGAYSKIKIPELLKGQAGKQQIEDGVMAAYNGYLLMCEKQPDSSRNEERNRLAIRVLVSGEIMSPGFIQAHKNRILPEYAELALNISQNQYVTANRQDYFFNARAALRIASMLTPTSPKTAIHMFVIPAALKIIIATLTARENTMFW